MKLFRFITTVSLFLSPVISLSFDKKGFICWFICLSFLSLHLFFIQYVKLTHRLDDIEHPMNINILGV